MRAIFLLWSLFLWMVVGVAFAQLPHVPYADSLQKEILTLKDSPQKVDRLCELAYAFTEVDDDKAVLYAVQAKEMALKLNYVAGIKEALTISGVAEYIFGNYNRALDLYRQSQKMKGSQKPELEAYNLMLMGNVHRDWANFDSAEYYYQRAVKTIGEQGDPYYLGKFYRAMATIKVILWHNEEAIELLKKAEAYAIQKPRDYNVLMNIWETYGMAYYQMLKLPEAKRYMNKLCNQEQVNIDLLMRVLCMLAKADEFINEGRYENALTAALEALQLTDVHRYPTYRLKVYMKIGRIYAQLSQYALASQYYFKDLKIAEDYKLRWEEANLYSFMAWVSQEQLNLRLAYSYATKSITIFNTINDPHGSAVAENIFGLIYYYQHKYDEALSAFEKSLSIRKVLGNASDVSGIGYNMAMVYEAMGNYSKAYTLYKESLETDEKFNTPKEVSISCNGLATLLIEMGNYPEAEHYLAKALTISLKTGEKNERKNTYLNFARLNEKLGDYKKAVIFHNRYVELSDSIASESNNYKLAELHALYEVERKEAEVKKISQQKERQENELRSQIALARQQKIIIVVSLVAIGLLVITLGIGNKYIRNRNKSHQALEKLNHEIIEKNEEIMAQSEELREASETISHINKELENKVEQRTSELKQAYKELDTFFYRSSHDFRRPITTFLGLAGVAKITVKDPNSLELFEKVSETATSLDKMLAKLQSISDVGSQQMIFKEVLLKEMIDEILIGFAKTIQQKRITVTVSVQEQTPLVSYPAMIKIVVENLIENAIHFCAMFNPTMAIRVSVDLENAIIEVVDNGQGISDEYKHRIFDMYFRANEKSKGNGLGLYIAQKAIKRLNGTIYFKTQYGEGSVFTVVLPNTE